jgi:hypothetical protein
VGQAVARQAEEDPLAFLARMREERGEVTLPGPERTLQPPLVGAAAVRVRGTDVIEIGANHEDASTNLRAKAARGELVDRGIDPETALTRKNLEDGYLDQYGQFESFMGRGAGLQRGLLTGQVEPGGVSALEGGLLSEELESRYPAAKNIAKSLTEDRTPDDAIQVVRETLEAGELEEGPEGVEIIARMLDARGNPSLAARLRQEVLGQPAAEPVTPAAPAAAPEPVAEVTLPESLLADLQDRAVEINDYRQQIATEINSATQLRLNRTQLQDVHRRLADAVGEFEAQITPLPLEYRRHPAVRELEAGAPHRGHRGRRASRARHSRIYAR